MFGEQKPRDVAPEFTRCCYWLPLSYGLLVWGYFKMVGLSLFAYLMIENVIRNVKHASYNFPTIIVIIFLCLVLIDIIFNIMLVVAGYMKYQHVLKTYNYYSLVFPGPFVVIYILVLGSYFYNYNNKSEYLLILVVLNTLYIAVPIVMVQLYVSLLVRSEVRKLRYDSNFQFLNTAADAGSNLCLNNVENGSEQQSS